MKNIYCVIFAIFLFSCKQAGNSQEAKTTFQIDINRHDDISCFFDNYRIVPLETTQTNLIGDVSKIQINDNKIYILDKRQAAIFIFDIHGKYINKIHRQGRAPEEYLNITDFNIYQNDIYCLARANRKILIYNDNAQFQKGLPLNDWYNSFYIANDSLVYLFSDYSNTQYYNYVVYDYKKQRNEHQYDKFEKDQGLISDYSPFHFAGDKLLVSEQYDQTLYHLSPFQKEPLYRFIFNTSDEIPVRFKTMNKEKLYDFLKGKEVLRRINNVYSDNQILFIEYEIFCKEWGIRHFITKIDTTTKKISTLRLGDEIDPNFPFLINPLAFYKDQLIFSVPSVLAIDIDQRYKVNHPDLEKVTETNNPILIFHHINRHKDTDQI